MGIVRTTLSLASIVQTARELLLWRSGDSRYEEHSYLDRPFTFAGHTFTISDDQPVDSTYSEAPWEGVVQPTMNGQPLGLPSRALVRRGRDDLGRYHGWFDAWRFRERATGRSTLWLARRLQPDSTRAPRVEVTTVAEDGTRATRVLHTWALGDSYPLFRATQSVRDGTSSAIPLSVVGAVIFPPFLIVFPLGTLATGLLLLRRGARATDSAPTPT